MNRRNLTFIICLILSVFIWSLVKLSKNLLREVSIPVTVINPPANEVCLPSAPNFVRTLPSPLILLTCKR